MFSVLFFGSAAFCFVGGYASDRIGGRNVFAIAAVVCSVFCGLTAFVFSYTSANLCPRHSPRMPPRLLLLRASHARGSIHKSASIPARAGRGQPIDIRWRDREAGRPPQASHQHPRRRLHSCCRRCE
jgi:hypothetical protein